MAINHATFATAEVVTAAKLNQNMRDNWEAVFPTFTEAWSTWAPTLVNLILGNGTTVARYQQAADIVVGYFRFTLGSSSAVGTAPTVSLPVTANTNYAAATDTIGVANIRAAATAYPGWTQIASTTTMRPIVLATAAAIGTISTLTATSPGTFTTGDTISMAFTYEVA